MTPLQQELKEFLQEKGVTPLFLPHVRGSKIIEFYVDSQQKAAMDSYLYKTFCNGKHRLTLGCSERGIYYCNFQPFK